MARSPGKDAELVFTPHPGSKELQKITLAQFSVNKALRQGESYKIVATLRSTTSSPSANTLQAEQLLVYLPGAHGFSVPLWLNAPRNPGQPFGEISYLKMDLPFGGDLAIL
jgi:hypothetical protein